MIDHQHKAIFVHIIKTAGVSIETQFNHPTHDHRTALDYQSLLGKERYQHYFSFTIVRNPWDKMVSQYYYNAHNWVKEGTSFEQYIRIFGDGEKITRFPPFHLPYITNTSNAIIVDYIGRFEDLERSLITISAELKIPYQTLPHKNKSNRKREYTDYYNQDTKNIIAHLFAEEIELFSYSFGK